MRSLALLAALVACGNRSTPPPAPARDDAAVVVVHDAASIDAAPRTLRTQLIEDIGKGSSVAILPGKDAVVAISVDGTRTRALAPFAPAWVVVDDRADAIWFAVARPDNGRDLYVIDLLAEDSQPLQIAIAPKPDDIGIRHIGPSDVITPHVGSEQFSLLLESDMGSFLRRGADDTTCRIENVECPRFVDDARIQPLLREFAARARGRETLRSFTLVTPAQPQLCKGCSRPQQLSTTGLYLVDVKLPRTCTLQLYDLANDEFISPIDGRRSKSKPFSDPKEELPQAWFCKSFDAFVANGRVVRIAGGATAGGGVAQSGGCLDGRLVAEVPRCE